MTDDERLPISMNVRLDERIGGGGADRLERVLWRCTTCGRERQPGDAVPPLTTGLSPHYRQGKCAGSHCKANRIFMAVPPTNAGSQDVVLGVARKEAGMGRAERSATPSGYVAAFDDRVKALAASGVEFTSEDVTTTVGLPPDSSGSAVGARMNAAAKRGLIVKVGRRVKARRPNQHAAMLEVWRGA